MAEIRNLSIDLLELNEGQMYGLPKNPRWIRDARFEALIPETDVLFMRYAVSDQS